MVSLLIYSIITIVLREGKFDFEKSSIVGLILLIIVINAGLAFLTWRKRDFTVLRQLPSSPSTRPSGSKQMPLSAKILFFLIICSLILNLFLLLGGVNVVIQVLVGLFLLFGIIKKSKLVWQWGQFISIGGIIIHIGYLYLRITAMNQGQNVLEILFTGLSLIFYIGFFISIINKETKRYFGLLCPTCGSESVKAVNFLYTIAKCNHCKTQW